ncbi:MAG: 50S ribosomal protein L11 [Candidatus Syntropharchaeia archaeon]
MDIIEVLVPGGKATPGPPLGPALGPLGVNVKKVVDSINEKTREYEGMEVPVKIKIDGDNIEIEVGTPPTSALIKQELGIEKAKRESGNEYIGDLPMEKIIKIAKMKMDSMLSYTLKNAVKEVVGTCVSMGVTIDGKKPKEVQRLIDEGEYDGVIV